MAKQVFGIAVTKLTSLLSRRSLYCSKDASSRYSLHQFADRAGNIRFQPLKHTWDGDKCAYCGAAKSQYDRSDLLESHAYEWIHHHSPNDIFGENFDVIITNPPYQLSDGGAKASAKPVYHVFVEVTKRMKPRYAAMIVPSRWFAGGKGLDAFRASMLGDDRTRKLVDYTDSSECFPGVDIAGGICYFLWDREYHGDCEITNIVKGRATKSCRRLDEFETFIRYSEAEEIVKKVRSHGEIMMDSIVSSRKPFGLDTTVSTIPDGDLVLRYNKGLGKYPRALVQAGKEAIDKWKTIISYASYDHAGQLDKDGRRKVMSVIEVLPPQSVCTETYLIAGAFESEEMALNLKGYFETKFVRFLVAQIAVSQHITRGCFAFVPNQDFSENWTDEKLYDKYGLTKAEREFIESMIKPMDKGDE